MGKINKLIEKKLVGWRSAQELLLKHPIWGGLATNLVFIPYSSCRLEYNIPHEGMMILSNNGNVIFNDYLKFSKEVWLGLFGVACAHYAFNIPAKIIKHNPPYAEQAALISVLHFIKNYPCGWLPEELEIDWSLLAGISLNNEEKLAKGLQDNPNLAKHFKNFTLIKSDGLESSFCKDKESWKCIVSQPDFQDIFAQIILQRAKATLSLQGQFEKEKRDQNTPAWLARQWFISHYPLLASTAAAFTLVEDAQICQRYKISVAAIRLDTAEIFINPGAGLNASQLKFVIAHEILHAALQTGPRMLGRDHYVWNLAHDFVINGWLIELGIGTMPAHHGGCYDEQFKSMSAEEVYYKLVNNIRLMRKLSTFKGEGCDVMGIENGQPGDMDDFCRSALQRGYEIHEAMGRGGLPAGLVEEIRVLSHPPIPWNVDLAEWMREHFPLDERRRTYARPSRRQSVTPNIVRPSYVSPEYDKNTKTFGVILDTSESMDRNLLGKGLGAISSYANAQDVRMVRLMFCDAAPHDEGWVPIEQLANRVKVRGGGGTVLQQGVNALLASSTFPKDAPILIITDAECESDLSIDRDHAFLVPANARLPFYTKKPIFYMD